MTRPHESPSCRCGPCAEYDESIATSDSVDVALRGITRTLLQKRIDADPDADVTDAEILQMLNEDEALSRRISDEEHVRARNWIGITQFSNGTSPKDADRPIDPTSLGPDTAIRFAPLGDEALFTSGGSGMGLMTCDLTPEALQAMSDVTSIEWEPTESEIDEIVRRYYARPGVTVETGGYTMAADGRVRPTRPTEGEWSFCGDAGVYFHALGDCHLGPLLTAEDVANLDAAYLDAC